MEISIKQLSTSVVGDKFKLSSSQCKVKLCVIFQLQLPSHPTSDTNLWWFVLFCFVLPSSKIWRLWAKWGENYSVGTVRKLRRHPSRQVTPLQEALGECLWAGSLAAGWSCFSLEASQHDLSPSRAVSAQREVSLSLSQCKGKRRPLLTFR